MKIKNEWLDKEAILHSYVLCVCVCARMHEWEKAVMLFDKIQLQVKIHREPFQ